MKNYRMKRILVVFGFLFSITWTLTAQESEAATEAGEDFDLAGVMSEMEIAEDLADLEKKINDSENQINNLDLNEDDEIDIVKIVEYDENNTRLLVLQAVLGDADYQDIATIEIEKHSEEQISLQIIGDPDLYGADYILEPASSDSSAGDQGGGDAFYQAPELLEEISAAVFVSTAVFVSVHRWRPISPLFRVGRVAFVSAVVWRPVPAWFVIRRPIARTTWRNRTRRYRNNRHRTSRNRHSRNASRMYSNKRKRSPTASKNIAAKPATKSSTNQAKKTSNATTSSRANTYNKTTTNNKQQNKATNTQKKTGQPNRARKKN